jgi:hypothetical protein
MAHRPVRALSVALLLSLAACSPDVPATDAPSVRDSAGVAIVEASESVMASIPEWEIETEMDLGGIDAAPEHQFHQVNGVRRLPDGRLVVVNSGSYQVRLFDPDGASVATVGREGEGPGEFLFPSGLAAYPPDSLLVLDRRGSRMTVLSSRLELGRTDRLEGGLANPSLAGVLPDGRIVVSNLELEVPEAPGVADQDVELLILSRSGGTDSLVGRFRAQRVALLEIGALGSVVFDPFTSFAVSGDRVWIGYGTDYELEQIGLNGQVQRIVRWSGPDRAVTEADREEWKERQMTLASTDEQRRQLQMYLDGATFAEQRAAYQVVMTSDEGDVWVQDRRPTIPRERLWLVFNPSGEPRATVRTGPSLRVFQVTGDRVVGVRTDELDIEHVVVQRIVRK